MTVEDALTFLAAHEPMPSDHEVSIDECNAYGDVLCLFRVNPDERCIPLLITSMAEDTTAERLWRLLEWPRS